MVGYSIQVFGKVQGVFFRASTQEKAQELGVRGWVRNEADGTVSIHAEGEPDSVQALFRWCQKGPPQADVRDVKIEEAEPENFTDFQVRR